MTPRKLLAMKLRSLGDTVLMTAPLEELKRAWPNTEIHVAVTSTWAPLLEGHPAVDRIWPYERHADRAARAKAVARMALRLRKERFDCVANFHASPSSATIAFATGSRVRSIHFHGHKDKNRYSSVIVPGKGILKPVIERDMDTIRALGIQVPAGKMPRVHLLPQETAEADDWLAAAGLKSPVLGLGLGASRPTKNWPADRFAELAIEWCRRPGGGSVLVPAGPDDENSARDFQRALDGRNATDVRSRIVIERSLPLRRLAAVLSRMAVFAGNDSGPKHVAVAVETPTVTVFGPENPFEWHPYPMNDHPYLFIEPLECRRDALPGFPAWCGLHECIQEKHRCMTGISVPSVLAECERVAR